MTLVTAFNFAIFHCLGWTFSRLEPLGQTAEPQDNSVPHQPLDQEQSMKKVTHVGQENKAFKAVFLISLFIIYVGIMFRDFVNTLFLFAIGHTSHLHKSKALATVMTTSYFGSFAVGRLASIGFARYVKVHIIWFTELSACVLFCALMAVIDLKSVVCVFALISLSYLLTQIF